MKILFTAFDPFGGESVNPALEAVERINVESDRLEIIKENVPTVFIESIEVLDKLIEKHSPDYVICVGQAGGRKKISVERVAINISDARICDNKGHKPEDETIFKDGENAYFATIPIKEIVNEINKAGIDAEVSNTAGTFVCNHLMYGALYIIEKKYKGLKSGFIHVPYIEEQVKGINDKPFMEIDNIVKALEIAAKVCASTDN